MSIGITINVGVIFIYEIYGCLFPRFLLGRVITMICLATIGKQAAVLAFVNLPVTAKHIIVL